MLSQIKTITPKKVTLKFRDDPWSEVLLPSSDITFCVVTLFLAWSITQNIEDISSLEAQQTDTSILSFSSGIIHINSHESMLAQSNKRSLLIEKESNANQVLGHRKIKPFQILQYSKQNFHNIIAISR